MKYLKNYKKYVINESSTYDKNDLIVDENDVEEYYIKNYVVEEESYKYMGKYLIQFINEEEFMDSVINDEASSYGVEDYSDEDYFISYINKSLDDNDIEEKDIDDYIIDTGLDINKIPY